jgi:hypothetical protein
MPTLFIANAFSLNMLDRNGRARTPQPVGDTDIGETVQHFVDRDSWEVRSIVGHPSTAAIFSDILGVDIPFNRESVKLGDKDILLVGQYIGPRLQEGATQLPEGAKIEWWLV